MHTLRAPRAASLAIVAAMSVTAIAACGTNSSPTSSTSSGSAAATSGSGSASASASESASSAGAGGGKIALLLPESKTTRYETFDRPLFEAAVKAACADCEILYSNADQDAAKQQQQAEAALTQGAKVLVLDAVDGKSAQTIVANAKGQGVKVIAYDRFVAGSDYYVSFDNKKVGELQGTGLVDALKAAGKTSGDIVMINGSPTDANAADFKAGAHSVLDKSGFTIKAEYDTPDWSPDKAQTWMESQLSAVKSGLVGVYAANDGTAGGAIAALKGGGVDPLPPVTGQDAELAAIQRVISGDQALTIYKAIKPEAEDAAKNAVALAGGGAVTSSTDKDGVPSTLLEPVVVTKDNIMDTIVADGFYKVTDICTGEFAAACTAAGIK